MTSSRRTMMDLTLKKSIVVAMIFQYKKCLLVEREVNNLRSSEEKHLPRSEDDEDESSVALPSVIYSLCGVEGIVDAATTIATDRQLVTMNTD